MPEQPIIPETPLQRLIVEHALALARQLEQAAAQAPPGQALDRCESVTRDQGQQFLRDALTCALQDRVSQGEKKGPASASAGTAATTKAGGPATS
jgi:hypothetical protein